MPSLEVHDLQVKYGLLTAVHGIDLTVEPGEIVVVLGSNGAGKTSTLNAISGRVQVAAGAIALDGQDVTGWPAHRVSRAGLVQVPEGRRIFAPLTIEENLVLGGYAQSRGRRRELLKETYELFPILDERRESAAGLLSGGEQQMLAFGRALMADPRVLLLDEPSMGLAPIMIDTIMESVLKISARGPSVLMVEQNATAAFDIATRAYVLEQGEIVLEGPASTVADDPLVLRAFLGLDEHLESEPSVQFPA